jgi:Gas vesicle synthesis protein GvpL/GvpF
VSDELLWAYGVVAAGAIVPADMAGVAGGMVAPVAAGGLAALTSAVPRADFDVEPLRKHLNELSWLGRVAREHEAVLEHALGSTTVVPLRLCTIFEDVVGVERMIERERDALMDALGRLEGRQEWGVKLLLDRDRLASATDDDQAEGGLAYLARRRSQLAAREEARGLAAQLVDQVDGALRVVAVDAVRLPAQNRELSHHEGEMVLNAAYLVGDPDELRACVDLLQKRYAAQGARIDLTGPWPPYNFVTSGAAAQPA